MATLNVEMKERITAAYEADPDQFELELEEIIEQIEDFQASPGEHTDLEVGGEGFITVVSAVSESGDRSLDVFPGALSTQQVAAEIFLASPSWWGSPEYIGFEEIKIIKVK